MTPFHKQLLAAIAEQECEPNYQPTFTNRILEIYWRLTEPIPHSGCWIYLGPLNARGYGPHVAAYKILIGQKPSGTVLHHKCCVKECWNPQHLEPLTPANHLKLHRQLPKMKLSRHNNYHERNPFKFTIDATDEKSI